MGQPDAPHHQHRRQDGAEDERGAEVGLQEHQHGGDQRVDDAQDDEAQTVPQSDSLGEHSGKRQDQQQLREFRRLKAEERQLDPAVRSHLLAAAPGEEGEDQKRQRGQVDVGAPAGEPAVVGDAGHQEQEEPDDDAHPLRPDVVERSGYVGIGVGRGIEHEQTESDEGQGGREQYPVHAAQIAAQGETERLAPFASVLEDLGRRGHLPSYSVTGMILGPPDSVWK